MHGNPLLLLTANGLELLIGVGIVLTLGLANTGRALLARLGLAYGIGLAATGIFDANLALVHVLLGLPALAGLAAVSLSIGLYRRKREQEAEPFELTVSGWFAAAVGAATAAVLGLAAWSFASRPLADWDGWAIWGFKAQALYTYGGAAAPLLTSNVYPQPSYPILFPSLEATDYRAMGAADPTMIHLQLALFAVAFVGSLFGLLWRRVPSELIACSAFAIVAAPSVLDQLKTNYADMPLAFFVALGVVALVRWTLGEEPGMLAVAVVFLGAATLTKNEGTMFAIAALVPALALVATRDRRRALRLLAAAGAIAALSIPWRIFTSVHHLSIGSVKLTDAASPVVLANRAGRVLPAAHALAGQFTVGRWALLVPLVAIGLVAAVLMGRYVLAGLAATWLLLSFAGLVLDYWVSPLALSWYLGTSETRVVASLVVGGAALAPLLAADAWVAITGSVGRAGCDKGITQNGHLRNRVDTRKLRHANLAESESTSRSSAWV